MIIRKFGRVEAPVDTVKGVFLDLAAWPEWMPSVRSARVLESTPDRLLAEVRQHLDIKQSLIDSLAGRTD